MGIQNISYNATTNYTVTLAQNPMESHLVLDIIMFTMSSFGFVSNIFVVVIIALYKPMHKQLTNIFIVNQSILDALVAVLLFFRTLFPHGSKKLQAGNIADEILCRFWYSDLPLWCATNSSAYSIVALTFERFLAVVYPIWHKANYRRSKILIGITIGLSWTISPVIHAA